MTHETPPGGREREGRSWPRGWWSTFVLASSLGAAAAATLSCAPDEREPPTAPAVVDQGEGGSAVIPSQCTEGARRTCRIQHGEHNGVVSCFEGVEVCTDGEWGPCGSAEPDGARRGPAPGIVDEPGERTGAARDGASALSAGPNGPPPEIHEPSSNAGATTRSLGQPAPCVGNPCDPGCQCFDETPDEPIEATPGAGGGSWQQGQLDHLPPGLVGKGLQEPCSTAADCQFNTHCDNPESGSCAHGKCATGAALAAGCDPCVDLVCAADPSCCQAELSCTERFGSTSGFVACGETTNECTFAFNARKGSCASVCADGGGSCVGSYDNSGTCGIDWGDNLGCSDTSQKSAICICSTPEAGSWDAACVDLVHTECGAFCPAGLGSCAHDPCELGPPLSGTCDGCVTQICAADAYCCSTDWDETCVAEVASICGESCSNVHCADTYGATQGFIDCSESATECAFEFRNTSTSCAEACARGGGHCIDAFDDLGTCGIDYHDHLGCDATGYNSAVCICSRPAAPPLPEDGSCVPWLPGQTDPNCAGIDLTVGVPCDGVIPVCNVGRDTAPAGVTVIHFPANSQQYPKCAPNQTHPQMRTCTTSEPIAPGQCISMTDCAGLNGNREIMVNPPGAGHVAECLPSSCMNNWSLYHDGPCEEPTCSGSSSEATLRTVSLYVMFDKSGSMGTNGMWLPAMNALEAFFSDAGSAGLGVALRFYPDDSPTAGCDSPSCDSDACADPLVTHGWLSADAAPTDPHEQALLDAIASKSPGGYTPTYVALLGAAEWAAERRQSHPEEEVGVVLVTDGEPNRCNPGGNGAIVQIAEDALAQHGVRTYAIGLDGANVSLMNQIASAGGTGSAFFISNGNQVQAELLSALEAIRGNAADCELPLSNPGSFDPSTASVSYQSGTDPPTLLQQVLDDSACGEGWYYDDAASPSRIILCPSTCARVQGDTGARIDVSIACAGAYEPVEYREIYESICPAGTWVQWGLLAYETTVPGDASVTFAARTAPTVASLAGSFTELGSATLARPDCLEAGPAPCPVDLYDSLGGTPEARQAVLELSIRVEPSSNGALSPSVDSWRLTYSCPDGE